MRLRMGLLLCLMASLGMADKPKFERLELDLSTDADVMRVGPADNENDRRYRFSKGGRYRVVLKLPNKVTYEQDTVRIVTVSHIDSRKIYWILLDQEGLPTLAEAYRTAREIIQKVAKREEDLARCTKDIDEWWNEVRVRDPKSVSTESWNMNNVVPAVSVEIRPGSRGQFGVSVTFYLPEPVKKSD